MSLNFEVPELPESVFTRFDLRWKLAAVSLCIAAIVPLRRPIPVIAAFLAVVILTQIARLPWRWHLGRLLIVSPLLIALFLFLPFALHGDGPSLLLGPIKISMYGFLVAGRITLKITAIFSLVLTLLATSSQPGLLKAARCLRVPGFLIQLVSLTWRYIFLVIEEFGRLRTALRVRGYRSRARLHNYRVAGNLMGTLLVRSAERAERVGHAMRCRGFDGRYRGLTEFRTTWRHVVLFVVMIGVAGGLLVLQIIGV